MVDLSDQFVEDKCVSACELGPCPKSDEAPAEVSAAGDRKSLLHQVFSSSSLGFALLVVIGIADLLL